MNSLAQSRCYAHQKTNKQKQLLIDHANNKMSWKLDMLKSKGKKAKEAKKKIIQFLQILRKRKPTLNISEWRKISKVNGNRMLEISIIKTFSLRSLPSDGIMTDISQNS